MLKIRSKLYIGLICLTSLGIFCTITEISSAQSAPLSEAQKQNIPFLNTIAQIATALGVGISTASILASYRLYQMSKRDEYVNRLRSSILLNQERCERLNSLINHELTNEIVNCVVYSRDLEQPLIDIMNKFFKSSSATENELKEYIKQKFPSISTPIHSPLVSSYDSLLSMISSELSVYQIDAPGFYRVMLSTRTLYRNIGDNIKRIIRDEDYWSGILVSIFNDLKDIKNLRELKFYLSTSFVGVIQNRYLSKTQKDINDLLTIVHMVSHAYLALSEERLVKISELEKRQDLLPVFSTKTIVDDLKQAEKCLNLLLDSDSLHKYWELVARFEERNTSESD